MRFRTMSERARTRLTLEIERLPGVHAVRAAWTALAAVPGIVSAELTTTGGTLEMDAPLDEALLRTMLESAGVVLVSVTIAQPRVLPVL